MNMGGWLCMPVNISPILMGTYSSDTQTTLDIVVSTCNNATDPNHLCAPQE